MRPYCYSAISAVKGLYEGQAVTMMCPVARQRDLCLRSRGSVRCYTVRSCPERLQELGLGGAHQAKQLEQRNDQCDKRPHS